MTNEEEQRVATAIAARDAERAAARAAAAEERRIRDEVARLDAEKIALMRPIVERQAALRKAYEEERLRMAAEAHEREWGHIVGKVVAAIKVEDGECTLTFHDGSRLHMEYDAGYYPGEGHVDVEFKP